MSKEKTQVNPTVTITDFQGVKEVSVKASLMEERKLFITGEICDELAENVCMQIAYLKSQSGEPVDIYINSPGGSVKAGLAILDILNGCGLETNVHCVGMAASMGAVILACVKNGKRTVTENSEVMIHEPLISGGVGGSASSIKETADSIMKTKDKLDALLSEATGKPLKEVRKATSFDNYMTAAEAVEFGLADAIDSNIF